jgi:hypothetical protein
MGFFLGRQGHEQSPTTLGPQDIKGNNAQDPGNPTMKFLILNGASIVVVGCSIDER